MKDNNIKLNSESVMSQDPVIDLDSTVYFDYERGMFYTIKWIPSEKITYSGKKKLEPVRNYIKRWDNK